MKNHAFAIAALVVASLSFIHARQTVSKGSHISATATIQAIDETNRTITLKNEKGEEDTYAVGPDVKRFNELKVGQTIKMTYYESLVMQLRKPGETTNTPGTSAAVTPTRNTLPGGTAAVQQKKTVLVKAVDMKAPSITVITDDGRTITRKVEDSNNLKNVKAGDKIDITYTQALLTSVQDAK